MMPSLIVTHKNDDARRWVKENTLKRGQTASAEVSSSVDEILRIVRDDGDRALLALAERFGDELAPMPIPDERIQQAQQQVAPETKEFLLRARERIYSLGDALVSKLAPITIKHDEFEVGIDFKPVERIACYVPSGNYPLPSTALMTTVPAAVAGVREIAVFSPKLTNEIIFAASLSGVREFYQVGGAQAVAAAAYGTESIRAADMFVGPGSIFVAEAKRQLQGTIGIDMLAGPSEVAVIADSGANPDWLALDLLSQAEHGADSRAILLTVAPTLAAAVSLKIDKLIAQGIAPDYISKSLSKSAILVLPTLAECIEAVNLLAPEHVELQIINGHDFKDQVTHCGALFIGYQATVPFGDYMSGANHTLPTMQAARFSGGLTPLTFLRPRSWLKVSEPSPKLATDTAKFADLEGLKLHAAAALARLEKC
jgi:histidinol dehydrogenase